VGIPLRHKMGGFNKLTRMYTTVRRRHYCREVRESLVTKHSIQLRQKQNNNSTNSDIRRNVATKQGPYFDYLTAPCLLIICSSQPSLRDKYVSNPIHNPTLGLIKPHKSDSTLQRVCLKTPITESKSPSQSPSHSLTH
jgi:hypothetical protein